MKYKTQVLKFALFLPKISINHLFNLSNPMWPMEYNRLKRMKKSIIVLLFIFCIPAVFAQETVIGSVYLRVDAGERYELYESSADSFRQYLKGWEYVGDRDKTATYSYGELYDKLKKEALRRYGSSYPDLDLSNFDYETKWEDLPDEVYNTQVCGSSTQYKKKEREAKYYKCSASVVVRR